RLLRISRPVSCPPLNELTDRLVHGDELGAVGKRRLDLYLANHLGDAVPHPAPREHIGAPFHQPGNPPAAARPPPNENRNQRHTFRMIELDAALETPARNHGSHGNEQLVLFPWSEVHGLAFELFTAATTEEAAPHVPSQQWRGDRCAALRRLPRIGARWQIHSRRKRRLRWKAQGARARNARFHHLPAPARWFPSPRRPCPLPGAPSVWQLRHRAAALRHG